MPRFVSLKSDKVNVRRGPSADQAIVWVFSRAGLPVEVIAESHAESKAPEWECVDLKAVADVPKPVTLAAIKAEPRLKDMVLAKNARLSVQPVSDSEWALVCRMGDVDTAKLK